MTGAVPLGVYTAEFPFVELNTTKIRPVIVVSKPHGKHDLVVVIPVSSQAQQAPVDYTVENWREAGLLKPSVAQVHKPGTIMQSKLRLELGALSQADAEQLKNSLRSLLQLN